MNKSVFLKKWSYMSLGVKRNKEAYQLSLQFTVPMKS